MADNSRYEALVLEQLYGLLEPDEERELAAFLSTPAGAELRARAAVWSTQLKNASLAGCHDVRFAPPADNVRPAPAPRTEPWTVRGVWTRWAVAACLLIVFGGLGGPAAYQMLGWFRQSHEVEQLHLAANTERERVRRLEDEQQARREHVRQEHENAKLTHQAAEQAYRKALDAARRTIESKDFLVRLRGPDRIQPGAPNEWQIDTLTKDGGFGAPKKIEVVVRDQKNTELHRETHAQTHGTTPLKLSPGFWRNVTPGSDLYLEVIAYTDDDRKSVLAERVPLARPVYVTHLVTDKPLYKPGEIVRFRSLTLDRATFLPPPHDQKLMFRLRNPDKAVVPLEEGNGRLLRNLQPVLGPDGKPLRGIGTGEYELPGNVPGGEYTLEVVDLSGQPGQETVLDARRFIVNNYVPDIFEKRLEFDGKSYGPGDTVQVRVEVSRTAGGPMTGARAIVMARTSENREIFVDKDARFEMVTDQATRQAKVVCNIRFKLSPDLHANRPAATGPLTATLAVTIRDGSDAEVLVRPIPLVEKELRVEFFPEGGDLIEGVPNRIYFQVRTPSGKPADLKGSITDGHDKVADVATLTDAEFAGVNRGQGVFRITPEPGKKYFLTLTSPVGITPPSKEGFPLPAARNDGVVLTAVDNVTERGEAIRVQIQVAKGPKVLHVGAYARGRLISQQRLEIAPGKATEVNLHGDAALGGVTRVTVFEEPAVPDTKRVTLVPRAERLVYRKPSEQLLLSATPDKARYSPAAKVALELSALDEKERPTPAILLVGVVNQSVIAMADNKTDRLLPTQFLLAGDVRNPADLEHADFLLSEAPKAALALDLLLGTQGWRRFAEQNILPVNPGERQEVERMLVAHGNRTTAPVELYRLEEQRLTAEYQPKIEQTSIRLANAQTDWDRFRGADEPEMRNQLAQARSVASGVEKAERSAQAELIRFETRAERFRTWALPAFLFGLVIVVMGAVALALRRPEGERRRYLALAVLSTATALLVVGGLTLTNPRDETERAFAQRQRDLQDQRNNRFDAINDPAFVEAGMGGIAEKMNPVVGERPDVPPALPKALNPKGPQIIPKKDDGPDPKLFRPDAVEEQRRLLRDRLNADRSKMAAAAQKHRPFAPVGPAPVEPIIDAMPTVMPFIVREYAHERDPSWGEIRSDFTETVFWHPVLVLPESGKTTVQFQLSDDIARYQVLVAGHTIDGRIGAMTRTIEARKPFTVDPKLPLEVSHTDVIDVPVRAVNDSDDRRSVSFTLTPTGLSVEGAGLKTPEGLWKDTIDLAPNGKGRKLFRLKPTLLSGQATLAVVGMSDPAAETDAIGRVMKVVPEGFPVVSSLSDLLEKRAHGAVLLPKDMVPGTLKVQMEIYPTSLADLVNGLEGLLHEPGGCFEQSSTANYPNSLVLDYLNSTNQTNPEAARRARELLERGYARLTSFECLDTPTKVKQGFEWFGAPDLAHEALTAYGLLQFKDMARVHRVDPELIKRTQAFLLSRRDGAGGFKRNPQALDSFGGAPKHTTDAYIVWALVESDPDDAEKLDLKREIEALKSEALRADSRGGKDSYFVALVANVLLQRGDRDTAMRLLDRLTQQHFKDGALAGAETSITRSGGRDLQIETTALTMLGWLRANDAKYAAALKDATRWLSRQRGGHGGFGSTQSTIMALKALILHAKKHAHPAEAGEIKVLVGGRPIAARRFTENDVEVIALAIENPEQLFAVGGQTAVEITTDARHAYPFALRYSYTTLTPVSAEQCALRLETRLERAAGNEGETIPLAVSLRNVQKQGHGMAIAIVGLPAGLKVPADLKQLTDLREKGRISFFELRGRELILYWRELAPEQKINLSVDLVCDIPGQFRGPASRAYLYYNAEHKHWVPPMAVQIAPSALPDEKVAQK